VLAPWIAKFAFVGTWSGTLVVYQSKCVLMLYTHVARARFSKSALTSKRAGSRCAGFGWLVQCF
jgi:hypothetical protein